MRELAKPGRFRRSPFAPLIALRKLLGTDPDCFNFLKSGIAGGTTGVFDQYYNGLTGKDGDPMAGAADLTGVPGVPEGQTLNGAGDQAGFSIAINTKGAFFKSSVPVGDANKYASQMNTLVGGTFEAREFILLHELAHYFKANGFVESDADKAARQWNNDLIWKNCTKTLGGTGIQ